MCGHLVKQQHAGSDVRCQLGMGQRQGNQHGLLLARGAGGGRHVLARHGHGQVVTVRTGEGALCRPVAGAPFGELGPKRIGRGGRIRGII